MKHVAGVLFLVWHLARGRVLTIVINYSEVVTVPHLVVGIADIRSGRLLAPTLALRQPVLGQLGSLDIQLGELVEILLALGEVVAAAERGCSRHGRDARDAASGAQLRHVEVLVELHVVTVVHCLLHVWSITLVDLFLLLVV